MLRAQSISKSKFVKFVFLTAIFSLNSSCVSPVFAEGGGEVEGTDTGASSETLKSVEPQPEAIPSMSTQSGGDSASSQKSEFAPAQTPILAPEQAPTESPSQAQVPSNDLVMQAPTMAMDPALQSALSNRLGKMEEIAFGASYPEHELQDRIDHLEEEVFKSKNTGASDVRVAKLEAKVFGQSAFTAASQASKNAGYMPVAQPPIAVSPGPSSSPNPAGVQAPLNTASTPIASVTPAGSGVPVDSGANSPPVIIPGIPSQQQAPSASPSPSNTPSVQPSYPGQSSYQNPSINIAPPYTTPAPSAYPGTRPNQAGNYYPNQNSGAYGYQAPYSGSNRPPYPSNYLPQTSNPYQYGSGNQNYQGQNYNQYQQYRPGQPQQPLLPQQPYQQPYQQYPQSRYPQSQYPNSQYPQSQYPAGNYSQYPQSQYPQSQYPVAQPPAVAPPVTQPENQSAASVSKNSAACDKVASAIVQSAKDGDYFVNIRRFSGGMTMHWQAFPVTVHLPKDSPESWRRALDGDLKKWTQYVPLMVVKGDEKAKIDVQWVNKLPPKILGVTRIEGSADALKVTIFVLRPTFYPSEIPENVLQNVFAHELGHSLGLLGHSTNITDVMYIRDDKQDKSTKASAPEKPAKTDKSGKVEAVATSATPVKSPYGADKPSARDLNTLKKLYMSAPLTTGFKLDQPLEYSFKFSSK